MLCLVQQQNNKNREKRGCKIEERKEISIVWHGKKKGEIKKMWVSRWFTSSINNEVFKF